GKHRPRRNHRRRLCGRHDRPLCDGRTSPPDRYQRQRMRLSAPVLPPPRRGEAGKGGRPEGQMKREPMTHDIYARMRDTVLSALRGMAPDLPDDVAARVEVAPARDPAHGDMATNAAMVAAKALRQPPAKIAAGIVAFLGEAPE